MKFEVPVRYRADFEVCSGVGVSGFVLEFQGKIYEPTPQGVYVHEPKRPTNGIMLLGPPGTGKSTIMGAMAMAIAARDVATAWVNWMDLLDTLAQSPDDRRFLEAVPALFVDDFGQHLPPEYIGGRVAALIEARYGNMLPICLTTNAQPEELGRAIGEAALSRLEETCKQVVLAGRNRRKPEVADATR